MSNGREHARVGTVVGAIAPLVLAQPATTSTQRIAESLGGAVGGRIGAALPDLLEPATSPRHRRSMHSVAAAGAITTFALRKMDSAADYCRRQANACEAAALKHRGTALGVLYALLGVLWHAATGFFIGIHGGYVSHLLLDACTPAGLPLF